MNTIVIYISNNVHCLSVLNLDNTQYKHENGSNKLFRHIFIYASIKIQKQGGHWPQVAHLSTE